jgi:hypothetical protein
MSPDEEKKFLEAIAKARGQILKNTPKGGGGVLAMSDETRAYLIRIGRDPDRLQTVPREEDNDE